MLHTKAIKYCTHTLFRSSSVLLYMWVLRNSRKSVRRSARVVCTAHALWAVWTWRDRQRSSDLNAIWRRAPAPPGHRPDHTHSPITINLFLWLHCQFRHLMVVFTVHSSFGTVGNHTELPKAQNRGKKRGYVCSIHSALPCPMRTQPGSGRYITPSFWIYTWCSKYLCQHFKWRNMSNDGFFYFEYEKWKAENSVGLDRLLE